MSSLGHRLKRRQGFEVEKGDEINYNKYIIVNKKDRYIQTRLIVENAINKKEINGSELSQGIFYNYFHKTLIILIRNGKNKINAFTYCLKEVSRHQIYI